MAVSGSETRTVIAPSGIVMNKLSIIALSLASALLLPAGAQDLPKNVPTREQLANDNKLFISLARKALKWEEPAEPLKIVGPLYFVGTKGLGVFLFTTSEGHILMNTGMPSSGPMIVESIRRVGFKPEDVKIMKREFEDEVDVEMGAPSKTQK